MTSIPSSIPTDLSALTKRPRGPGRATAAPFAGPAAPGTAVPAAAPASVLSEPEVQAVPAAEETMAVVSDPEDHLFLPGPEVQEPESIPQEEAPVEPGTMPEPPAEDPQDDWQLPEPELFQEPQYDLPDAEPADAESVSWVSEQEDSLFPEPEMQEAAAWVPEAEVVPAPEAEPDPVPTDVPEPAGADIPGAEAAAAARAAADAAAADLGLSAAAAELLHSLLVLSATDLSRGYPWRVHRMSARDWYEGFLFEDASSWLMGVGEAFSMRAFRTAMSGPRALAAFNSLPMLCMTPGVREETSAGVQTLIADPLRIARILKAANI